MKRTTVIIILLVIVVIGLIVLEASQPQPLDWTQSYLKDDKRPNGTWVMHQQLDELMPGTKVQPLEKSIDQWHERLTYEHLGLYEGSLAKDSATQVNLNYIYFHKYDDFAQRGTQYLLDIVGGGANVFMITNSLTYALKDTLGIDIGIDEKDIIPYEFQDDPEYVRNFQNRETAIELTQKPGSEPVTYKRFTVPNFFKYVDEDEGWEVLAKNAEGEPVLIRNRMGKGQLIMSSTPGLFTNFNMLIDERAEQAFAMLSYLPVQQTYYDVYYRDPRQQSTSRLRVVLDDPALKWAYYTGLIALVLAVIFFGKRRQRLIPVIYPPENTSMQYAETLGRLYYQHSDHKNIADKRIDNFLADIRTRFYLRTNNLDEEFMKRLHNKTGFDGAKLAELIQLIKQVSYQAEIEEDTLIKLNQLIEDFYAHTRETQVAQT